MMVKPGNLNTTAPDFILEELTRGNEKAFNFIFRQYYKQMGQFAFSIVKDQGSAESICQEVFVKLWEKRKELSDVSNLNSYLARMVRNQCIDFLRKEKSNSKRYSALKVIESDNTTEEEILKNEFEEKLLNSMMRLPGRCREAIELSRFDGLSNREIAQRMQISVKGVEALIGRSLKFLRIELHEFLPSFSLNKQKNGPTLLLSLFLSKLKKLQLSHLD